MEGCHWHNSKLRFSTGVVMTAFVAFLQALRWAFGCASWFNWSCSGARTVTALGLWMTKLYTTLA